MLSLEFSSIVVADDDKVTCPAAHFLSSFFAFTVEPAAATASVLNTAVDATVAPTAPAATAPEATVADAPAAAVVVAPTALDADAADAPAAVPEDPADAPTDAWARRIGLKAL